MAKVVKIPLVMKNGERATDMKSLIDNFDVESVIGYFLDGKLEKWLNDRYYEDEADAIAQIDRGDPTLTKKLCEVFGIEYDDAADIDPEAIAQRKERIVRLKQFTIDEDVLDNIDFVAFDQEELAELYDKGVEKIYLCEGEFRIPKSKQNLEYQLIGDPNVTGLPETEIELKYADTLYDTVVSPNYKISKQFADKIGIRSYVETTDYVVYYKWFDICNMIVDDETDKFVLYNKRDESISTFTITGYESFSNRLLGAVDNILLLSKYEKGAAVAAYDIETNSIQNLFSNVEMGSDNFLVLMEKSNIVYLDKGKRLHLYDFSTKEDYIIAQHAREVFSIHNEIIFYETEFIENGYKYNYFCAYDISSKTITKLFNTHEHMIEQIIGHQEMLYILSKNVWDESIRLIGLDSQKLEGKYVEYFKFSWKCSSYLKECVQKAPYFVFISAEAGLPLYVFNLETKEMRQVSSGCGKCLSGSYYINTYFQVVGDNLYFQKGDTQGWNDVYCINLKENGPEQIIGTSQQRSYFKK